MPKTTKPAWARKLPRGGARKHLPRPLRDRMHYESKLSDADEALRWTHMVDQFIEATKKRAQSLARKRVYSDRVIEAVYWEWYNSVHHAIAGVLVVSDPAVTEVLLESEVTASGRPTGRRWIIAPKGHPAAHMGPRESTEKAAEERQKANYWLNYHVAELAEELPDGQTGPRQIRERRAAYKKSLTRAKTPSTRD